MKNPAILVIPILLIAAFGLLTNKLIAAGTVSPSTMILIGAGVLILSLALRPKKQQGNQKAANAAMDLLGEFANGAFADDAQAASKFQSAVNNYLSSQPKAALSKLSKLESLCKTDHDTYAVSVLTALCKCAEGDYETAIKLYNKAVVLNPTTDLAMEIGSCYQRMGDLEKAMDSYGFALDLDPNNIAARSALATACVGNWEYEEAIDHAKLVLEKDETNSSALATMAISYGLLDDPLLYKQYKELAVQNGYKEEKITSTVDTLKKRMGKKKNK